MNKAYIIIAIMLISCDTAKKANSAQDFINKAKTEDLEVLFNVAIEARNEKNDRYYYYYSHIFEQKDTITLPSFEFFDELVNQDSTYFIDIYKLSQYNSIPKESSLTFAKGYAQKLDAIYQELGVVNTFSHPDLGRFIRFTIDRNCKAYYLENSSTLKPYWKAYFKKLNKVNEKWFYECQ